VNERVRGRGAAHGIALIECAELGSAVSAAAFERGLLVETGGPEDEVVKPLPPLTIGEDGLRRGLDLLAESVHAAC
jgi:diaminobutyrate-2-oxoglutarate transaminase